MTEHHWRDEMKSLSGSHVAPEKTKHLEETKKEIENKVKRILKLIKDEGEGNLNIESQLVDLVMEYFKKYESLNEHHGDHTAELKEIFHFRGETSSSQYSSLDPSSKEKASGSIKQTEAAYEKGRKFFEDLQARDDQLKDEKEQRTIQGSQIEVASLQTQKKELEEQFEEQNLKLQLVQTELRDKILELERISKEKGDIQSKLKLQIAGKKQEAEGRKSPAMKNNNELASKVASLRKALKRSTKEHKKLLDQSEETYFTKLSQKDEIFDSCMELSKQMKEEIEIRNEAIIILQDEVNRTDTKLQLSNKKLQLAETLLVGRKEVYRIEEENIQRECKELKEQNSKLSNEIDTAQRDLSEIRSSLEKTRNSFSGLEVVFQEFQENKSSFQRRIVEVSEAHRIVKKLLMDTNGKIEELEKRLNVKEDEVLKMEKEKK